MIKFGSFTDSIKLATSHVTPFTFFHYEVVLVSSTDFELDDNYSDDDDVSFDEASGKISAKESLEKRRLIDDLLAQRRLERELKDFDYDLDDDDLDDDED